MVFRGQSNRSSGAWYYRLCLGSIIFRGNHLSWRANCDVQVLLYKGNPDKPNIMEIAAIVDYIIAYCNKGNATQAEELIHTKNLVLNSQEITGCRKDVLRVCRQVLNTATTSHLVSLQEATVMLADMPLFHCTETIESVSLSNSQQISTERQHTMTSSKLLKSYTTRLRDVRKNTMEYYFLAGLSLRDFFLLQKNVLPPVTRRKNIKYLLDMYHRQGEMGTLEQFFHFLKYRKNKESSSKYIIPNFVGVKSVPIYPVTNAYALFSCTRALYQTMPLRK